MRIEYCPSAVSPTRSAAPTSKTLFRLHSEHTAPRTRAEHAYAQLNSAWSVVVRSPAPPRAIAILTAHWALETDGGRAMPGHNFAGIKAAAAARGAELQTVEGYGPARREVTARFRVYDSAEAGARDYVHLLASRFPAALEAACAGNPAGFAQALAQGGYFTADPAAYSAGLEQRLHALEGGAPQNPNQRPGALLQMALAGVLGALRQRPEDA
ncbi:MAG: glucosaminidase domain-containing protein [Pseudomonadota bacterium]